MKKNNPVKPLHLIFTFYFVSFLLFISCSSANFISQEELKKKLNITEYPNAEEYPNCDAIVLYDSKECFLILKSH